MALHQRICKKGISVYANVANDGIIIYSTVLDKVVVIISYTTEEEFHCTLKDLHDLNKSGYVGEIYKEAEGMA